MKTIIQWVLLFILIIGLTGSVFYGNMELDKLKHDNIRLTNEVKDMLNKLEIKAKELLTPVNNLGEKNTILNKELDELKEETKRNSNKITNLEKDTADLKQTLSRPINELESKLETQTKELLAQITVLEQKSTALNKTSGELKGETNANTNKINTLEKNASDSKQLLTEIKAELETIKERVDNLANLKKELLILQISLVTKLMLDDCPKGFIQQQISDFKGIVQTHIPSNVKLEEYMERLNIICSSSNRIPPGGEQITLSNGIKDDNSPKNLSRDFTVSADLRIYAFFPTQGNLKGLDRVVTRWLSISDNELIYLGVQPINASAPNNFVYFDKKKGWNKGIYQVELFKLDTLEKVAQGTFEIKK